MSSAVVMVLPSEGPAPGEAPAGKVQAASVLAPANSLKVNTRRMRSAGTSQRT